MNKEINNGSLKVGLRHILSEYERVFLVQEKEEFLKCLESVRRVNDKNCLLLIPYAFKNDFENLGLTLQFIAQEEMEEIVRLYYMYEFSNRFCIISNNGMYGNVFNLVKNGLLTYEEAFEVIME